MAHLNKLANERFFISILISMLQYRFLFYRRLPSCLLFIVAFFVNLHSNIILRLSSHFFAISNEITSYFRCKIALAPMLSHYSTSFFFKYVRNIHIHPCRHTHTYACRSDAECKLANNVILNQLNFPVACSVL